MLRKKIKALIIESYTAKYIWPLVDIKLNEPKSMNVEMGFYLFAF